MEELFNPDNLSAGRPSYSPVTEGNLLADVSAAAARFLGFCGDTAIEIESYDGSNAISDKYRIEVDGRRYFLKRRTGPASQAISRQEVNASLFLNQKGIKAPNLVPMINGDYVLDEKGSFWLLSEFCAGNYFSGRKGELKSAAAVFAKIAEICSDGNYTTGWKDSTSTSDFIGDLPGLIKEVAARSPNGSADVAVPAGAEKLVRESIDRIGDKARRIESIRKILHLDYHPMNLLMNDGRVDTVLDFEWLIDYPVTAGLGFCGYKLIRETVVQEKLCGGWYFDRGKVNARVELWLNGWHMVFPSSAYTPEDMLDGAVYRILFLIHRYLDLAFRGSNPVFLYDLPKQYRSLSEAEILYDTD